MATRRIKQETIADRSSPTIPNSSRAQTISSTTGSPEHMPTQATDDSDTTMSGAGDGAASLLQDAMEYLGADSRRLIQAIKRLEELNINTTLQLPKFVVVGDQSAGKSSIVEALCDISLPRSQGTCTRCPFLITTSSQQPSNGATWSCSISIHEDFYYHTRDLNKLGKFTQRDGPAVVSHFVTVTNKGDLEPMLRRAQMAILNPREDPQRFVNIDNASLATMERQVPFSPNVVSLEIQGPNLPELYFYDLPGSINVIEDEEDQGLVLWIEQLVTKYIEDEKCLILLACGADQDVETSTTFRFIKGCGATQRCAGVLTKADLLPRGKMNYVTQIVSGKKFTLGKGWFITKQLSQAQIDQGISHAMARELEANFFSQVPWTGLANLQARFGIESLKGTLSGWMTEHFRGELPKILSRIANRFDEVSNELAMLPESPPFPAFAVASDIQQLASNIASHITGDQDANPFREGWDKKIKMFTKLLIDMKPKVTFATPGYEPPAITVDDDDSEPETPTPVRTRVPIRSSTTPAPSASTPQRPTATPSSSKKRPAAEPTPRRIKAEPSTPSTTKQQDWTLDKLRAKYTLGNTSAVPGHMNAKVTDRLILASLSGWDSAVVHLLSEVTAIVTKLTNLAVDTVLKNLLPTDFYRRTKEELAVFVAELMHKEGDHLRYLLSCEQEKPIVTHTNWSKFRNERLGDLQKQRNLQRVNEHFDVIEANSSQTSKVKITPLEKREEKARDLAWLSQTLGVDEWTAEIDCMATILCYYESSVMGFVNTAAKSLEYGVLRPLRSDVAQMLRDKLQAGDPAVCATLLAEDPERERLRLDLTVEKEKLEKAMASIGELQK